MKGWRYERSGPFKGSRIATKAYPSRKRGGRKYIRIVWKDGSEILYAYARYLMSVKLGRILNEDEVVHHMDGDPTNDNIRNLRVMSTSAHNKEHHEVDKEFSTRPENLNQFYRQWLRCLVDGHFTLTK